MLKYLLPSAVVLAFFLSACNLTQDVEIELPDYSSQPVVECYLEPGKPFRVLLTRSFPFFDPVFADTNFLEKTLIQGASITISYDGKTETLNNIPSIDLNPLRFYNYSSFSTVEATPGIEYTLNITLPDGGQITGKTIMLPKVNIDSIVVEPGPDATDTLYRMLTYITDDMSKSNFYRRLLNYSSLDSFPDQDFIVNDRLNQTASVAFGTGYELAVGDTAYNTIFHISEDYYNYLESVQLAIAGSLNPFAQPSTIKSNVRGSANPLGIFTALVYDRDTTIIKK
jgi:hypothetical protein